MNINLFALTGFGNVALKTLFEHNIKVYCLYTRKEKGPFPYYEEEPLDIYAKKQNIKVEYISSSEEWVIMNKADMNLIVTYHRIFKEEHLKKAGININIHPSLLPLHKGANPFKSMMESNDKVCGLSAHYVEKEIDNGEVILQKSYPLIATTEAQLREYLAIKTSLFIKDLLKVLEITYKGIM